MITWLAKESLRSVAMVRILGHLSTLRNALISRVYRFWCLFVLCRTPSNLTCVASCTMFSVVSCRAAMPYSSVSVFSGRLCAKILRFEMVLLCHPEKEKMLNRVAELLASTYRHVIDYLIDSKGFPEDQQVVNCQRISWMTPNGQSRIRNLKEESLQLPDWDFEESTVYGKRDRLKQTVFWTNRWRVLDFSPYRNITAKKRSGR